jgi:hypothetical protein
LHEEIDVTGDYQVRVTWDTAGLDGAGVPRVTRTPARVEIAASQRKLLFADRDTLQQFIDACVRARDEAFGVTSNPTLSEADKEAWVRFFGKFTDL